MSDQSRALDFLGAYCPVPLSHSEQIVIGHGSGGRLTHNLIEEVFAAQFKNPFLEQRDDGAVLPEVDSEFEIVLSTDSHVISPIFFPGGDIGRLAICGTVNDISVMGAKPLYLSAGFILEEGLQVEVLKHVVSSMVEAAEEAGVQVVAGDTKVVEKGKGDGIFINTTGIGIRHKSLQIGGCRVQVGDQVILSGTIGEHGVAVLLARGELGLTADLRSDVAPLNQLIAVALEAGRQEKGNAIHAMRDPTRGGIATALIEIARQSNVGIQIDETAIPIREAVLSVCEMLGFDPLYMANEGKCLFFVDPSKAGDILKAIRSHPYGVEAAIIGEVIPQPARKVLLRTSMGSTRLLEMLSGEMLPRIC
ncbi:MAG: hydrogenase expression/formation protein HypE [Anaerolineales bacterium]|nr:hydrogenase expression/formation protein HypE [Anaerolineales bacterium]MCS7247073.1 hydrogenase expression/formation protein HypE [Anaerolineales bacterium]MDW8160884.1 hydrogenase expression/formation protein HypE [Anaerolineales bacterium]MDW8447818.1 hydrogenase expression/formation protein HypE [Anaerolineales bacterium]